MGGGAAGAMGSYPIAAVIFFASVVVPLKILALLLCYVVQRARGISPRQAQTLSHDRICGALVDDRRLRGGHPGRSHPLDNLMTIYPGPAAVALPGRTGHHGGCHEFDSRLIWDLQQGEREREERKTRWKPPDFMSSAAAIWMVPLLALFIGAWMLFQHWYSQGPSFTP